MRKLDADLINQALEALGFVLALRGQRFEIVVIGGRNLVYSGLITRPATRDLDLLGEMRHGDVVKLRPMPTVLTGAIQDVGRQFGLPPDWINLGPDVLLDKGLPDGFCDRLEPEHYSNLTVWFTSRLDLIAFKIYAAANLNPHDPDADRHLQDLQDLDPSARELEFGRTWMTPWAETDLLAQADGVIATLLDR